MDKKEGENKFFMPITNFCNVILMYLSDAVVLLLVLCRMSIHCVQFSVHTYTFNNHEF